MLGEEEEWERNTVGGDRTASCFGGAVGGVEVVGASSSYGSSPNPMLGSEPKLEPQQLPAPVPHT